MVDGRPVDQEEMIRKAGWCQKAAVRGGPLRPDPYQSPKSDSLKPAVIELDTQTFAGFAEMEQRVAATVGGKQHVHPRQFLDRVGAFTEPAEIESWRKP